MAATFDAGAFDFEAAWAEFEAEGVAIIHNVLPPEALARARAAVDELIADDAAHDRQLTGFSYDPDLHNIRIQHLVARHETLRGLAEHPIALAFVHKLLGRDARLSNFSGNRTRPGSGRMFMHADQGFVPSPWPPYAMAINVGWALDDFTAENGGTLYVPASNHETCGPQPERRYAEAVPVACPAGSIFVMDGRVWHQTGENVTRDVERTGLFAFYVRPFIVPQMAWHKLIDESRESEFTPTLWSMLGLSSKPIPSLRSYSAVKT